ncbi:MAG: hypothetical protein Q8Q41_00100 [bacterium]|nr:hypothetical protein [bacterium]
MNDHADASVPYNIKVEGGRDHLRCCHCEEGAADDRRDNLMGLLRPAKRDSSQ